MELAGKRALISGGGRGLGRAIALAYAQAGAQVAVMARSADEVAETVWLIEEVGQRGLALVADVQDSAQVQEAVAQAQAQLGPLDTLVNSAGVGLRAPIHETSEAQWDMVLDTLLKGTFLVTQALIGPLRDRGGGNVINLCAPLERIAVPGFAAYYAAKCAVEGLTKVMAKDLRRFGINVNGLHPGGFADTRLVRATVPEVRSGFLDPHELAAAAIALAAQPPRGQTGQIIDAHHWAK